MTGRPEKIDVEVARLFLDEQRVQFADVRPPLDYVASRERIPGAVHMDPGSGARLTQALFALPREKMVVAYCDEPNQAASSAVARLVRQLGIGDGCALEGGFRAWKQAGCPTELIAPTSHLRPLPTRLSRHLIERTSDGVELLVQAPSLGGLFVETAVALADALGLAQPLFELPDHVRTLGAPDAESLLLLWTMELLELSLVEQRLFLEIALDSISERQLHAHFRGMQVAEWLFQPPRHLQPAVRIERHPAVFEATVSLDRRQITPRRDRT